MLQSIYEPDEIIYRGCSMTKYKIFVPKTVFLI